MNGPATSIERALILSADIGGGHDALAAGLVRELGPAVETRIENGLAAAHPKLGELAREGYRTTLERSPWSYQLWFWILSATQLARIMRWLAWRGLRRSITRLVDEARPDVVVATYPYMTAVLGKLRREGSVHVPTVGLLIDSGPHDLWVAPGIDLHVAMNPGDVARVEAVWPRNPYYPALRIATARPAVDPRCFEPHDRDATRAQFGLPIDRPVLLVSGGSWGLPLPERDLEALAAQEGVFVAIACGRNDELAAQLERDLPADRVRAIGFTSQMPALIAASDAAVLNAGGMTCYECFMLGTPVVLYRPLPGHGVSAAEALDEDGLATWARSRHELLDAVEAVATCDGELATRAARARALREQPPLGEVVAGARLIEIPPGESRATSFARQAQRRVGAVIVTATVLGIGGTLFAQREAIAAFDWSVSPPLLALAIGLFMIGPVTQSFAFWSLLRFTGVERVALPDALAVWSWSSLARYAPSGLGAYVVRVRSHERLQATRRQVLVASVYEQVILAVAVAIFSAGAFTVSGTTVPRLVGALAIVGVGALVAMRPAFLGARLMALVGGEDSGLPQLPRGRAMGMVVALNVAGWLGTGAAAVSTLTMFGHAPDDPVWAMAAYSFAWLSGYLMPMAPGGLGVREGVLASLLAPSFGAGVAVSIALAMRVVHTAGDMLASAIIELTWRSLDRWGTRSADGVSRMVRQLRALARVGIE